MRATFRLAAAVALACSCAPKAPYYSDAQAISDRRACKFSAGASVRSTIASDAPVGSKIPINNVVVVMQENRSFDSYFSKLSHGGIDVAAPDATNPDAQGNPVSRFHQTALCFEDTSHSWEHAHQEYDNGKLDGFVVANDPDGARAMGYFDETELPYYYSLARAFAISDRHFCSVLTSTWTNRMYLFAATSWGLISNDWPPPNDANGDPYQNIFLELNAANVSWKVYSARRPTAAILLNTLAANQEKFVALDTFYTDAKAGTLPAFSLVEPDTLMIGVSGDEHPPADPQPGEAFTAGVAEALFTSPLWAHSALFITYDEHGGLYDHVPPPTSCIPDDLKPSPPPVEDPLVYDRYGFRVPLILVSPYAKRGHVSHNISDHTSITRFIEARFNLPAMTARDANADPLFDLFDFSHPQLDIPPLAPATVDPDAVTACLQQFPGTSE